MYYWKTKAYDDDFLVLEPCDWTADEWKTLTKLFGCVEAERIVVRDYTLEVFGTPTLSMSKILEREEGTK